MGNHSDSAAQKSNQLLEQSNKEQQQELKDKRAEEFSEEKIALQSTGGPRYETPSSNQQENF